MRDRSPLVLPLILALGLLAAAPAAASIARAVSFEEKVGAAEAIVLGKVVSTESAWDPSGRWILTRSTFQVEKALKGTPAPHLTLVTPGGTVGSVRQETIGVPSFRAGDEHVVFVRSTSAGPTVAFFDQGVFDVTRDSRGAIMVAPASSELILVTPSGGRAAASAVAAPQAERLDAFERRIEAASRSLEQQRLEMGTGGTVEPPGGLLSRFAREHRTLLIALSLGLLLALAALLYKRP